MVMGRLKEFFETTQDRIEQLFGRTRLAHLPQQGEYWRNFIGLRSASRFLLYRLQVAAAVAVGDQILRWHE